MKFHQRGKITKRSQLLRSSKFLETKVIKISRYIHYEKSESDSSPGKRSTVCTRWLGYCVQEDGWKANKVGEFVQTQKVYSVLESLSIINTQEKEGESQIMKSSAGSSEMRRIKSSINALIPTLVCEFGKFSDLRMTSCMVANPEVNVLTAPTKSPPTLSKRNSDVRDSFIIFEIPISMKFDEFFTDLFDII